MFKKNADLSTDLSTEIPQKTRIFVIIVHFGDPEPTDRLVQALIEGEVVPNRIIVVDHAEKPYQVSSTGATCVRPPVNGGYFLGLQYGIVQSVEGSPSPHDLYLLMNNDIEITAHSVKAVRDWWALHGSSNVLAGPFLGSVSLVTGRARVGALVGAGMGTIPYVHGACIVAQYQVVRTLPFTELFMYWEDVALSIWARTRGMAVRRIPETHIAHDDTDQPLSDEKLYYLVRNGAYVLENVAPFVWQRFWRIGNSARLMYHSTMPGGRHGIVASGLRDARKLHAL